MPVDEGQLRRFDPNDKSPLNSWRHLFANSAGTYRYTCTVMSRAECFLRRSRLFHNFRFEGRCSTLLNQPAMKGRIGVVCASHDQAA